MIFNTQRDGWNAKTFHKLCDKKVNKIIKTNIHLFSLLLLLLLLLLFYSNISNKNIFNNNKNKNREKQLLL